MSSQQRVDFVIYTLTDAKMSLIFILHSDSPDPNINYEKCYGEEMYFMTARVQTVVATWGAGLGVGWILCVLHCVAHVQNNLDFAWRSPPIKKAGGS